MAILKTGIVTHSMVTGPYTQVCFFLEECSQKTVVIIMCFSCNLNSFSKQFLSLITIENSKSIPKIIQIIAESITTNLQESIRCINTRILNKSSTQSLFTEDTISIHLMIVGLMLFRLLCQFAFLCQFA